MGFVWFAFVIISLSIITATNPGALMPALTEGATKAANFAMYLLPVYAIWLGVLELMGEAKLTDKIAKLLMPVINFLFGEQPQQTRQLLATNIAGNLIGVGSVATPSGIMAAMQMQEENETILKSVVMLIVLNSSSLQIMPTTVISLRAKMGSANPSGIFAPAIVSSIFSTVFAVMLVKVFVREKKNAIATGSAETTAKANAQKQINVKGRGGN